MEKKPRALPSFMPLDDLLSPVAPLKHPKFHFITGDAKDVELLRKVVFDNKIEIFVAAAAIIGGISMFHKLAYFLLAENERITCAAFDVCVEARKAGFLEKVAAGPRLRQSTYGFQKLACEYFAKGAWEQHQLPYTIIRPAAVEQQAKLAEPTPDAFAVKSKRKEEGPFNAVGIGEQRATTDSEVLSGNVKLAMSHVVPDLVQKILKGQKPLHILGAGNQKRHYTYAGDLARGIVKCIMHPKSRNEVLELAEIIWKKLKGPDEPFEFVSDEPFQHDVQMRVPCVEKAKAVLDIECTTPLETALDEVIPWIEEQASRSILRVFEVVSALPS
ncbi:Uxs1 [Symbiodinium microadriaticum]|nr:Uxs1 [Symbiodinium microadriaticum]